MGGAQGEMKEKPTDFVKMIGLDFGSTTSSAIVAHARVRHSYTTGRIEFGNPDVVYRSDPVFTPFSGEEISEKDLTGHLERWLAEATISQDEIFSGGTIITGLAARQDNAVAIAKMVGSRIGESVIATADDPCLESWLAFMGSCSVLSRYHATTPIINLDIGGGTTNPALGMAGNVISTGCYFVGARHFQFDPGTYRLTAVSTFGRRLMDRLEVHKTVGDHLSGAEIDAILSFYVSALEAIASGDTGFFTDPVATLHEQVRFNVDMEPCHPVITFSGGVGELVYRHSQGLPLPGTTFYGDLGIDLARRIVKSSLLSANVARVIPENMGRATVYGLALYSTEVGGATIYLPRPETLPIRDLPVVARLPFDAGREAVQDAICLAEKSHHGACIQIASPPECSSPGGLGSGLPPSQSLTSIKRMGTFLSGALENSSVSPDQPIVLLISANCGKAMGNYATNWNQQPVNLIVVDEIPDRNAHFVNIGRPHNGIVPVSFFGMH